MSRVCLQKININIQRTENLLHVFGKRRLKFHIGLFLRMNKTNTCCMQHLPFYGGYQLWILLQKASLQGIGSMTINRIPYQGMPQMGEMNANLVCSARLGCPKNEIDYQ